MIQPIGYRALIKQVQEGKTKGGLILPENVSGQRGILGVGEVVAVGKSRRVKVGDRVYYRKMAGNEVEIDGEKYSLVATKFIAAKEDGSK
jgi:chaperonin GroES